MATIIYKDGKQIAVNYDALKRHLAAGWSTSESPKSDESSEVNAEAEPKPKPKRRATRKKAD